MKTTQIFILTIFILSCSFILDGIVVYSCVSGLISKADGSTLAFVGTIVGAVNGIAALAANWWYGTNKGSSEKDATLNDVLAKSTGTGSPMTTTTTMTPDKTTTKVEPAPAPPAPPLQGEPKSGV